ncbi:ZIP zinc transporter-domain-containing protein [Coprinopsis sp. MPI-PUGE-AT-0042]|nr:ZIP zinc transporter-domain-containing protein [Coprinopsis sp. MPI-PUGE-AT-0042]
MPSLSTLDNATAFYSAVPPSDTAKVSVLLSILAVSLVAVSFPAISSSGLVRIPDLLFFIGKHLGTGVILATAFIHLLPDSFDALLSRAVRDRYGNVGKWTGLIILASLLAIFLVEYISTTYVDRLNSKPSTPSESPVTSPRPLPDEIPASSSAAVILPFLANTPKFMRLRSSTACLVCPNDICVCIPASPEQDITGTHEHHRHHHHHHHHEEQQRHHIGRRRQIVGIFVLQLGIMIHSLVIGLTLSVTTGSDFTSLTTAVIFHQLFEGLSLGIRIAALPPAKQPSSKTNSLDEEDEDERGDTDVGPQSPQLITGDFKNNFSRSTNAAPPMAIEEPPHPQVSVPIIRIEDASPSTLTPLLTRKTSPSKRRSPMDQRRPRLTLEWRGWSSVRHFFQGQPLGGEALPRGGSYGAVAAATNPDARRSPSGSSSFLTSDHEHHEDDHDGHIHTHTRGLGWLFTQLSPLKTILSFLFGITTPIGMVIGMLVLKTQHGDDEAPLKFFQGIMSAISAGMLIYAATVEMIAGDFVFGDVEGGHGHGHGHHHHHHHHDSEQGPHHHHHGQGKAQSTGQQDEERPPQASLAKKALAVVSLLVGVVTMVVIGLGE